MSKRCPTCGEPAHNFSKEEILDCIPPKSVMKFGEYRIRKTYRNALYLAHPNYTTREVVGSFLGHNPIFPSQEDWLLEKKRKYDMG